MGTRHRRRRSTLAVVAIVTVVVGIRLTGAGAVQPIAGAPAASSASVSAAPASQPPKATTAPTRNNPTSTATRNTPTPTLTPTPSTSSPSPTSPSPTSPSPTVTASPSVSTNPSPTVSACAAGSVRIGALAAVGDANSTLVAGSAVRFTLEVSSSATAACTFVPVVDLVITSGHDRIWTSADCPVAAVGGPGVTAVPTLTGTAQTLLIPGGVQLGRGSTASLDLVWPGVRSAGSCTAPTGTLTAGTYVASITVADAGSTGTAFQLH